MKVKHLVLAIIAMALTTSVNAQSAASSAANEPQKQSNVQNFCDKHLRLSGYLQGGFQWTENDKSTFYLRRARVSLTGDFLEHKLDYRLQVDMAGSPKICDLYVRYRPFTQLGAEIGQFKLPFSLENELYGPTTFELIEYSFLTTYLARNDGRYDGVAATGRGLGAQLYGGFIQRDGFSIINYNIGVFNGSGINAKDNNKSKDAIARLIIKPIKHLSLSGSFMYGESNFAGNEYLRNPRWSVGAIYDDARITARAEYAAAKFGDQSVDAFYVLGGYHFDKGWSVAARYEFMNDSFERYADMDRITIGGVYKPIKYLRLQLNYSYTMHKNLTDMNASGVNLMVSAIF